MMNYLTLKEASKLLRVSKSTIYKLATTGAIPATKIGKMWRVDRNALEDHLKNSDLISSKTRKKTNEIKKKILEWIEKGNKYLDIVTLPIMSKLPILVTNILSGSMLQ